MPTVSAMAATFAEITLEEMESFLKRAFRVTRPKKGAKRGEVYYDLRLSDNVCVRVWTSIAEKGRGTGAGVGEDAIRVQLMYPKLDRPLQKGKAPIVKRTQGWRSNLQDRIEDAIETYEDKDEYWENRLSPSSPAPESKDPDEDREHQEVEFERQLEKQEKLKRIQDHDRYNQRKEDRVDYEMRTRREAGFSDEEIQDFLRTEGAALRNQRKLEDEQSQRSNGPLNGRFSKLKDGTWGVRVEGMADPGDKVFVTRQDGRKQMVVVDRVQWKGKDNYTGMFVSLCSFVANRKNAKKLKADE